MELVRLVDLCASRLSLNIEYDAAALKGSVTLRLDEDGLSDTELWTLLNRALASRGYTTIRVAGRAAYGVVKLAEAAGLVTPTREDEADVPTGEPLPGFRSVIIAVRHRSAKDAADAIGRITSKPGGSATVLSEPGSILVSDLAPRIELAISLLSQIDRPATEVVVEEIPVRNLPAQQLATLVAQIAAKRDTVAGGAGAPGGASEKVPGEVLPGPDGNTVLLVAPSSRVEYWKSVIGALDARARTETVTYTPRHFPSADVAKLLEQTMRSPGTAPDDRWRVIVDDLSGGLIVSATPAQQEQVRAIVDRLDAVPEGTRRPVRIFVIKNRPVLDVKSILDSLMQAGVLDAESESTGSRTSTAESTSRPIRASLADGRSNTSAIPMPTPSTSNRRSTDMTGDERGRSAPTQGQALPNEALSRAVGEPPASGGVRVGPPLVLTADEGTNTLIALGEPRRLAQIEALLKTLDVRQPQVMLDVLMVTLTDSQSLNLGAELEKLQTTGDVRVRLSSMFGLGARGAGGDNDGPSSASGFTGVVLSPGDFSIVLRALQTLSDGRSLSMPKLLVGNNQSATLDSVVQQPYASVNASNTVSTTSFGGTQDAGTVITIKPQIAEGDHLALTYTVSLSSFLGASASANLPPPRQQNRVQSVATIPDGHTVVVGGIELENTSRSTSQIPLVGDVPLLGELFKTRSNTDNHSRFYVFIRASVLRNRSFDDLKHLSRVESDRAGVDDDWPRVQPRVMR
ncbi:MAG: hypothetical protein JNM07_09000 [Phycisphaerae bacterium]|nr:hypothetical protein [Phycisphaerae bacterium]